jgi:hypothetical protein
MRCAEPKSPRCSGRLVVDAIAQMMLQLARETGDMAQWRAQIVRHRIAESLEFAVDVGNLLTLPSAGD